MVSSAMSTILKNLGEYPYEEDRKNFTFKTYDIKHVEQHNLHNELSDYGVQPLAEDLKIHYFQEGNVDPSFALSRARSLQMLLHSKPLTALKSNS
jgi:hypothetical protein